jgi:hypothetical protein
MKTFFSSFSYEFKLLLCIMGAIFLLFFLGIKIEQKWFPRTTPTFFADPGITIDIKVFPPEIEKPGSPKIGK